MITALVSTGASFINIHFSQLLICTEIFCLKAMFQTSVLPSGTFKSWPPVLVFVAAERAVPVNGVFFNAQGA